MRESFAADTPLLPNAPRIAYTIHHDIGIHELTFRDASRQAVDDWAVYQLWLDKTIPVDQPIFELIDTRVGVPSMSYVIERARHTIGQHSKSRKYHTAVLFPANQRFYVKLFASLINGLHTRNVNLRLVSAPLRAEAIEWLLAQKQNLVKSGM